MSLIPKLGRSSGEGNGNPLQYSCLKNHMDRRIYGVTESQTRLSDQAHALRNYTNNPGRYLASQSNLWLSKEVYKFYLLILGLQMQKRVCTL